MTQMWKNLIATRSSKLNQSEYSDTRRKNSTRPPWTKSLTNATVTMVFRKYDVTLTIALKFSLRVAEHLGYVIVML